MTAIFALAAPDAAHVLADGAYVGDRINLWPSPRFTAKSVTALNAEAKSAAGNR